MADQAGTFVFVGASGRTYTVDAFVPDAIATQIAFNVSGIAVSTSPDYFTTPESVVLVDVSIGTAPTAVGAILQTGDANVNGATIRWANQLAANPNRMKLKIPIPAGVRFSALQF